jgi:hypothetical protein
MKPMRKKKAHPEELEDDGRPVPFEALAELTSSEVIEQVKAGLSRVAPLEELEDEDLREDAA